MIDIDRTFREAEQIPVTDLWPGIVTRTPRQPQSTSPGRRVTAIVAAIVIAVLGVGLVLRALSRGTRQPATPSPTPTVSVIGQREVITHGLADNPSMWLDLLAVDPRTRESTTLVRCPDPGYYRGSGDGCLGPAAWSPERTRFAYTLNCYFLPSDPPTTCDQGSGIWVADARGNSRQLVSFEGSRQAGWADWANRASFAWSPDGSEIAYISPAGGGGLYVANADGTGSRLLPGTSPMRLGTTPVWSPDGSRIAFASDGTVSILPLGRGAPIAVGTTDPTVYEVPAWSHDGEHLAFVGRGGHEIDVVNADGSGITRVGDGSEFAWSPVADRIAYIVGRPGDGCFLEEIRIASADASDQATVLSARCESGIVDGSLGWSPDGAWIAFFVFDPGTWRATRSDGSTSDVPFEQLQEVDRLLVMSWNPCRCTYEPDR
jgi:Tol biopolymer transport system component